MKNFPPPIFSHFGGKIEEIVQDESIICSFQLKREYENPLGIVLGGVYGIFFDLAIGPFSYFITGKPCTSLDLNIDFLKSVKSTDDRIFVKSRVVSRSKSFLLFSAEAFVKDTLVASAKSIMMILTESRMK